jgi:nucleoside-diphosphate-sugar epimerase
VAAPQRANPVVVFGASGAAGQFLLPRLAAQDARVVAVSRRLRPSSAQTDWIAGDLDGPLALPPDTHTIVSLGPLDAFAAWFARAAPASARRVVALSSMSADSKRGSPDAAERELAARLAAAERALAEAARARGAAWTILRPTLIYGGGRDASLAPIARFARRWHLLPVPWRAHGLRQPIHADDVAAAVAAALDRAATFSRVYELGGGERLGFDAMLARIAAAQPGPVLRIAVPRWVLRLALLGRGGRGVGAAALARLDTALIADNAPAQRDFGHAPRAFDAHAVLPPADNRDGP